MEVITLHIDEMSESMGFLQMVSNYYVATVTAAVTSSNFCRFGESVGGGGGDNNRKRFINL